MRAFALHFRTVVGDDSGYTQHLLSDTADNQLKHLAEAGCYKTYAKYAEAH